MDNCLNFLKIVPTNYEIKVLVSLLVFANDPGDLGSKQGRVISKTQKMVLDASLLNSQHYKVRIEGQVEQSREGFCVLPLHLGVVAIEKGAFGSRSHYGHQLLLLFN